MRRLDMSNVVCVMMCTHERESCLKSSRAFVFAETNPIDGGDPGPPRVVSGRQRRRLHPGQHSDHDPCSGLLLLSSVNGGRPLSPCTAELRQSHPFHSAPEDSRHHSCPGLFLLSSVYGGRPLSPRPGDLRQCHPFQGAHRGLDRVAFLHIGPSFVFRVQRPEREKIRVGGSENQVVSKLFDEREIRQQVCALIAHEVDVHRLVSG